MRYRWYGKQMALDYRARESWQDDRQEALLTGYLVQGQSYGRSIVTQVTDQIQEAVYACDLGYDFGEPQLVGLYADVVY